MPRGRHPSGMWSPQETPTTAGVRRMMVHFRGHFGYRSRRDLGRAVASAQAELDQEDDDAGSRPLVLGEFRATDTQLAIDVCLPLRPDVLHAAANVLSALSREATCGLVEATCNEHVIDLFPFGGDSESETFTVDAEPVSNRHLPQWRR